MAKKIDYPRASVAKSIELANAVYELGGSASMDMCAEQMGRKVGGGFKDVASAAVKFGLITNQRGQLSTTKLFQTYVLGYSNEEKSKILQESFLKVPLFSQIFNRFKNQKLPIEIFDKLLIREFDVNQQIASRVAKYFIDGAKATGILNSDNTFSNVELGEQQVTKDSPAVEREDGLEASELEDNEDSNEELAAKSELIGEACGDYSVKITGPGMNHTIIVKDEDDLDIVDVILKKVRRKISFE